MRRIDLFLLLLINPIFLALPLHAQTYKVGGDDCPPLLRYIAPKDVAVDSGVDAKGNNVAPADLNPPVLSADDFSNNRIFLDIPVSEFVPQGVLPFDDSETLIGIGDIDVALDGKVKLNGKVINDNDQLVADSRCANK